MPASETSLLPADSAHWEHWLLQQFDACHDDARDALAVHDWSALETIARRLGGLSGQLDLAISQGFSSQPVDARLQQLIDFLHKAMAQAQYQDQIQRQKEVNLREERQHVVVSARNQR